MIKQIFFFLSIVLVVCACSNSHDARSEFNLTAEEKQWMGKFFDDLLFVEGGAYTVWGSKPITEIVLYHYTDEEMNEMLKGVPQEDKKNCYVEDSYDLPLNWEKWEKICSRFPMKKYLIFRSHYDEDGKASFVYIVDILKTAVVLESNYELFQKAVGFDFHPLEAVLNMPNRESAFWQKIRQSKNSSLLWGLLFGYGKMNAYAFYWKHFNCPQSCRDAIQSYPHTFSNPPLQGQVRISIDNFIIPSFISFSDEDDTIARYVAERDKIKKTYRTKDRLQLTLHKLTGS